MKECDLIIGLMAAFGKKKYSFADLDYLTMPFKVTERNLRAHLSRLAKKGVFEIEKTGRNAFYSLSKKSRAITENVAYCFITPSWKQWKNTWWGISYSLPSSARSERYRLVKKMTACRFALLYGGFWIRPFNRFEKIEEVFNNHEMKNYFKLIRFQPIKEFTGTEIQELWNLHEINKKISDAFTSLKNKFNTLQKLKPEKALIEKMETGSIIIETLFTDPLLPDVYLPKNWKGDDLRRLFAQWDKKVTETSKPYWSKIYK